MERGETSRIDDVSDPTELGQLFDDHAPTIYRYAARRVGPDRAEDVTAEVFCAALAGAATFDPARGTPIAWLMGIVTNTLSRHWRTERRQLDVLDRFGVDPLRADSSPPPDGDVALAEEARSVARALTTLPDTDREALLLFAWADLSYAEVAAALDVPVGTVRSRISRARSRLREELAAATPGDADEEGIR